MAEKSLLDRLAKPIEVDPPAAVMQREDVSDGTLVLFLESKRITPEAAGKRAFMEHTFVAADDRRFKLYGTAELNTKLRKVRPGARVYLRYMGQSDDENHVHLWDVRQLDASHAQMQALRDGELKAPLARFQERLDVRWEEHRAREAEWAASRNGRTPEPPPHDDRDIPPF